MPETAGGESENAAGVLICRSCLSYGLMARESTDRWDSRGARTQSSKEIRWERLDLSVLGLPSGGGALIFAAPEFPVIQGDLQHGFGGFVQPAIFRRARSRLRAGRARIAAEMDVRGFPAHVIEQTFFVAFGGQGADFNPAAIGSQPAYEPVFEEMDVGIANADGSIDQLVRKDLARLQLLPRSRRKAQVAWLPGRCAHRARSQRQARADGQGSRVRRCGNCNS